MQWKEAVFEGRYLNTFISLKWVNSLKLHDFFFSYTMAMDQFTVSVFSTALNP